MDAFPSVPLAVTDAGGHHLSRLAPRAGRQEEGDRSAGEPSENEENEIIAIFAHDVSLS